MATPLPDPNQLASLSHVLVRSHRATPFVQGCAAHRGDPDAALLHDFAELLPWVHAPARA